MNSILNAAQHCLRFFPLFLLLQELLAAEQQSSAVQQQVDIDDLLDDPELERLHAERLASLQREAEKRAVLQRKGHGELQEARPVHKASLAISYAASCWYSGKQTALLDNTENGRPHAERLALPQRAMDTWSCRTRAHVHLTAGLEHRN